MRLKLCDTVAVCLAIVAAAPAFGQSAENVATHSSWTVFVADNPKECYIVASPTASTAKRDGKPTEVQRGDIQLFVSFRPGEKVTNEVSFTGGYPFGGSSVGLAIGSDKFNLGPGKGEANEWAWTDPSDDSRVVAAMRKGANAKLTGTSTRGTATEDTFSLAGFTAAVEDAAARCR